MKHPIPLLIAAALSGYALHRHLQTEGFVSFGFLLVAIVAAACAIALAAVAALSKYDQSDDYNPHDKP